MSVTTLTVYFPQYPPDEINVDLELNSTDGALSAERDGVYEISTRAQLEDGTWEATYRFEDATQVSRRVSDG